ncbi:hypothetical protein C0029_05690 [Halioglobus japonicus]|uniref:Protein kinase domain-containing protein n=2 Tax=Halioglobus japonicus TaxID=930805 RepID=A0AAP8SPV0_9GAMM|nr:hypothetical protein C0029_05690 [Halioglobus japonicus]
MGEVYLAQDLRLQRSVAVKYLRADLPEGNWGEHLKREALLLAQLNHPNVVQIYDLIEDEGRLSLVMEYVEGRNLFLHLREHRVDLGERLRWLAEISAGLAASHEAGVTHCDLKAENVLISPAGTAKVNDFGIASEKSDSAEDVLALGRLAESMLVEHRHNLSPDMEELLAALINGKASQRPTAAQAAERFRFAWYEYYQQETPLPAQLAPAQEGTRNRRWFAVSAILLIALTTTLVYMREPSKVPYIAIASTDIVRSNRHVEDHMYVAQAVHQALQEAVEAAAGIALVSYEGSDLGSGLDEAEIIEQLNADALVTSRLDCSSNPCLLQIARFNGNRAESVAYRQIELADTSTISARNQALDEWPYLFPEETQPQPLGAIDETTYRKYLDLRRSLKTQHYPTSAAESQLHALFELAPGFTPLYRTYSDVTLQLYRETASSPLLERLEQRLAAADSALDDPEQLDYQRFLLAISREELGRADQYKIALIERGTDPGRASYMQGEILNGSGRYDEAMPYFAAASIVQPSPHFLTRQSSNAYKAGELYDAHNALIVLQERYPGSTVALDALADYQISTGQLDLAVDTMERSLGLSAAPRKWALLGIAQLLNGDYKAAQHALTEAVALDPGMPLRVLQLGEAEELLGNTDKAQALYEQVASDMQAGNPLLAPQAGAVAFAHLGQVDRAVTLARSTLRQPYSAGDARAAALVYTLSDMQLDALGKVEEAIDKGSAGHYFNLPWFDALCEQPRFEELMQLVDNDARCETTATGAKG